jgi:hypothetical protein
MAEHVSEVLGKLGDLCDDPCQPTVNLADYRYFGTTPLA